jgi:phosphopantetheinyl transferase (holo-ACP synthase)
MKHLCLYREGLARLIGNDIVDLCSFDAPLYRHVRYLGRACTPAEASALRHSRQPARDLAVVWAAKEAAFKLAAKVYGRKHFVPREFMTNFADSGPVLSEMTLEVSFDEAVARVAVSLRPKWVHAIATFGERCSLDWRVREIQGRVPNQLAPAEESECARRLALELFAEYGFEGVTIDSKRGIPELQRASTSYTELHVSLSHHGMYVAAAAAWSAERPYRQRAEKEVACSISTD